MGGAALLVTLAFLPLPCPAVPSPFLGVTCGHFSLVPLGQKDWRAQICSVLPAQGTQAGGVHTGPCARGTGDSEFGSR